MKQSCTQLVTALDALDVLVDAPVDVRCASINDAKLLKEVKVGHIDHSAVHLFKANLLDITKLFQGWDLRPGRLTVEKLLQEIVCAHWVENLIVAKLPDEKVLIKSNAPLEEPLRHALRLKLWKDLVCGPKRCELESVFLARCPVTIIH